MRDDSGYHRCRSFLVVRGGGSCGFRSAGFCAVPIPGTTIRHTIGSVGDIDGLWLLQIGEPVGVGFLRAVVETYVVTSGEGTPQPEPDGRAENRAVVTEGVVFSVFVVGIRPRRQGGDEIGVDGPPDGCGSQSVGHGRYYDGLQA